MALHFEKHKSLKNLNTFGFDQRAELFAHIRSEQEIEQAVHYASRQQLPLFVLGGGSNLVIVNDIPGLVIQLSDPTVLHKQQDEQSTLVTAGAGVNWHSLVQSTLAKGVRGLENLSLIPGSVGAAPVQNIGAYGVEIKDRISQVRAFHIPSLRWVSMTAQECDFSYRHSRFKDCPDEYIISSVTFVLGQRHALQTSYTTLHQHLLDRKLSQPSPQQISESVIAIRRSRLPDPALMGNAGSFFHNPIVTGEQQKRLLKEFPQLRYYPQADGSYKLAAAWLIDNLGYKGLLRDGVGVHDAQALVLINTGSGSGDKIMELAREITDAVSKAYDISLTIEPRIMGKTTNPEVICK